MNLESIEITSDTTGGDAIPGGYITEFQCLEVDFDGSVVDIGGI